MSTYDLWFYLNVCRCMVFLNWRKYMTRCNDHIDVDEMKLKRKCNAILKVEQNWGMTEGKTK